MFTNKTEISKTKCLILQTSQFLTQLITNENVYFTQISFKEKKFFDEKDFENLKIEKKWPHKVFYIEAFFFTLNTEGSLSIKKNTAKIEGKFLITNNTIWKINSFEFKLLKDIRYFPNKGICGYDLTDFKYCGNPSFKKIPIWISEKQKQNFFNFIKSQEI